MRADRIGVEDLDWVVERLAQRRAALAPYAPVFWRPAADAVRVHRWYLGSVLSEGGGVGFRAGTSFLIAVPGRDDRWIVDDAVVPDDEWGSTGQLLWDAFGGEVGGGLVRFVCPVPEPGRAGFARAQGLRPHASWWHETVEPTRPPAEGREPRVEGATASLVPAPPVYDPGGPVLLLTGIREPARAIPAARAEARRLGCPLVVADQPHPDTVLAGALRQAGYRRHCDFFHGELQTSQSAAR